MEDTFNNGLITIMIFSSGFKANLLRTRLEDSGIVAFVFDENITSINPLYNHLVGGIKLKVRESDKEAALQILSAENLFPLTNEKGEIIRCPKCSSENIESGATGVKSVKSLLAFLLGVITLSYPLHMDSMFSCGNCGYFFKK